MFLVQESWKQRVLATKKQKRPFLWFKPQSSPTSLLTNQNMFSVLGGWKKGILQRKTKSLFFCNVSLEASNFIANTPKHVFDKIKGQKHSLRTKTRKNLLSET